MNRQQMEIFLSLAKNLNFTKTANEFYTSQPTISRQISLLEEEWEVALFVRNKREVRLTPAGTIMFEKCQEALKIIDDGLQESRETESGTTGNIRIGFSNNVFFCFCYPVASFLIKLFLRFTKH
jgi:DNA-binding transcriptional LysR family regulator